MIEQFYVTHRCESYMHYHSNIFRRNGNDRILHIPQNLKIEASLSDAV